MKRLRYWWYRRQNDHPCKDEIYDCLSTIPTGALSLKVLGMGIHFCETNSLEETASDFNVTRERIRQILWKIYYRAQYVARNV